MTASLPCPDKLFRSTQNSGMSVVPVQRQEPEEGLGQAGGQTLFIDARKMGHMLNRTFKDLSA